MPARLLNLGDSALTLELGDRIDPEVVAKVTAIDRRLREEVVAGRLAGLLETVPTYRSLTVLFDPLVLHRETLKDRLLSLLEDADTGVEPQVRCWLLPVCYEETHGPDLAAVAAARRLTPEGVIRLHSERPYTVYMIGFLPGFPYMGDLDPALEMPRRKKPRVRVPVGAVAITGRQTAIYPWESPGGWQLIGRCPVPLFDAARAEPALLAQGDRVQFEPVSAENFRSIQAAAQAGALDFGQFLRQERGKG